LKKLGVTKLITSPLIRARETAEELAKESGAHIVVDERSREFVAADVGPPDFKIMRAKARAEREWAGQGGESFNASIARLGALLDEAPEHTCIVTHELLLQNFLISLGATQAPHIEHLSILTVEKVSGAWRVVSILQGRSVWQKILKRIV
jgi:2,3-bisphosphoglycerate-dependent phosphoglycerate mutase